ncbi:Coiled-coil domain-containing protein 77 [Coccomyxa sp. Obi]|nr:Coiled-coil domain-containing protein 77 [Coccomyxa sp. Obi]
MVQRGSPGNGIQMSSDFVAHQLIRAEDIEKERQDFLEKLDACAAPRKQVHELEWELKKRADEIRDLQKALSSSQAYIFEERDRLLQLQAENDELRLQEVEDRHRLEHLLALLDAQKCHKASSATRKDKDNGLVNELSAPDVDILRMRVESLQSQLTEQKQFAAERIAALVEERRMHEVDEAARNGVASAKHDELLQRLHRTEDTLQATTKDYILAKKARSEAEQRAAAAEAELKAVRAQMGARVAQLEGDLSQRLQQAHSIAEERLEQHTEAYRCQVLQREKDVADLEAMHRAVTAQLEQRLAHVEARLAKETDRCRQLEHRHLLDVEGWTNDITLLRKALEATDRKLHQMRLSSRLPDDERLDALMGSLDKRHPDVLSIAQSRHMENMPPGSRGPAEPLSVVNAELQHVRGGIAGLEKRLKGLHERRYR